MDRLIRAVGGAALAGLVIEGTCIGLEWLLAPKKRDCCEMRGTAWCDCAAEERPRVEDCEREASSPADPHATPNVRGS
jgi:hypothetical protein